MLPSLARGGAVQQVRLLGPCICSSCYILLLRCQCPKCCQAGSTAAKPTVWRVRPCVREGVQSQVHQLQPLLHRAEELVSAPVASVSGRVNGFCNSARQALPSTYTIARQQLVPFYATLLRRHRHTIKSTSRA